LLKLGITISRHFQHTFSLGVSSSTADQLLGKDGMDTEDKVYRDLQKFLDTLPGGFSATKSGSDIRLLKYLFTPEEARVAMDLPMKPETAKQIHNRIKKSGTPVSMKELQRILDRML
jgi:hypothetical protein